MPREYVNNKELLQHLIEHKRKTRENEEKGLPPPRVSEEIGECILLIARNLAKKPNFSSYSFKEDMISDGVENCISYIHNFNPEEYSNPFSYFTQTIYYAFLRRIETESKQTYVKFKSFETNELYTNHQFEQNRHVDLVRTIINEKTNPVIDKFEERMRNKALKQQKKSVVTDDSGSADLENFWDEESSTD